MNSHKSIGVVGQGFVGGSLTTVFAERGFDVYTYDKVGKRALHGLCPRYVNGFQAESENIAQFVEACEKITNFSNVYFVCLPTPMYETGEADLSIVEGVLKELAMLPGERIAVVKSTVPPGSTERWNDMFKDSGIRIIFNPEFLTEANALDDMRNQNRIILGGPRPQINNVRDIFSSAFPTVPIFKTSAVNAEMVKYVANTFLATKVSFANEIFQLCEKLHERKYDIDYDRVIELAKLDKRLGDSHWQVPGPMKADDGSNRFLRGYAGSCFVKDINALIHVMKNMGVTPTMLNAAWEKNLEVRPERDWEKLVGRAVSKKTK